MAGDAISGAIHELQLCPKSAFDRLDHDVEPTRQLIRTRERGFAELRRERALHLGRGLY